MIKKFVDQHKSAKSDRLQRETAVYKLSLNIQDLIGLEEVPDDFRVNVGDYDIVSEHRRYTDRWVRLLEIVPKDSSTFDAIWVKWEGTKTINLPPNSIVQIVLNTLRSMQD